jgi:hypothetical protein
MGHGAWSMERGAQKSTTAFSHVGAWRAVPGDDRLPVEGEQGLGICYWLLVIGFLFTETLTSNQ